MENLPDNQEDEDGQTKRRLKRGKSSSSSSRSRSYSSSSRSKSSSYRSSSASIKSTSKAYYKKYTTIKNKVSYSNSYFRGGRSY
jgi:hypothetical protein